MDENVWKLVQSSVDGMLVLDSEGTIRFANPAAERMFGRPIEGANLGLPLAPSGSVVVDIVSAHGVHGRAEMRLNPFVWENEPATLASLRDITGREKDRRLIQEERDFFSALMENLGALVLILDKSRRVKRVNRTCLEARGLRVEDVVDKPLAESFPDLEECIAEKSPPLECETHWEGCIVAWRLTSFGDNLICTGYDITERCRAKELLEEQNRELEKARLQAEAGNRAKTDFLAMMSHELRTPMAAVLSMLELLLESSLEQEQMDYLRLADTGARELLGLLDDILAISKIEAGHMELRSRPFALPRALHRLVGVLQVEAERRECKMSLQLPKDLPESVIGDWGRLRQVLLNLLGNALKFCEDECGLKVEVMVGAPVTMLFSVWDSGKGILPEDQKRIFQPFVQGDTSLSRRHEGAGLGLAIASSLVSLMGGSLQLESRPGEGSTFFFQLTLPPSETSAEASAEALPDLGPLKVLLVDDNPMGRRVASLMLKNWGYEVETVEDGIKALRRLRVRDIDVVLLDIRMPGMNGYQVLEALREREGQEKLEPVPVIALTAHCVEGERERCLRAGMDDFLTKPMDRTLLHNALQKLKRH